MKKPGASPLSVLKKSVSAPTYAFALAVTVTALSAPAHAAEKKAPGVLDRIMAMILPEATPPAKPTPAPTRARPAQPRPAVAQKPRPAAKPPAPKPTPAITVGEMAVQLKENFATAALSKSERADLTRFYQDRNFEPVWFEPHPSPSKTDAIIRMNVKGPALRKAMIELNNHGLKATQYWSAEAENAATAPVEQWKTNELLYSRALIRSAKDLNIGRIDPSKVGLNKDIKLGQKTFTAWDQLREVTTGPLFMSPWDQFAPHIPAYDRLHTAMGKIRAVNAKTPFGPLVPAKTTLKAGSSGEIVRELKIRAAAMGYAISNIDTNFDSDLEDAVKDIQKANLTAATGVLKPTDTASWSFFKASSQERVQEIAISMEKMRWLPNKLEDRHLFINLATQKMNVVDPNLTIETLREQKVIVGKPTAQTRTPTFRNLMTYVVINPTWSVPSSIFFRSKLKTIQDLAMRDPNGYGQLVNNWFYTNGFSIIFNQGGQKYYARPDQINWFASKEAFMNDSVTLRQAPSYDNALGVVKFLLNNDYAIWLHDTNERHLFANSERTLSSGCIRLEKPRDLAEYLLAPKGFSRARLESTFVKRGQYDAKEIYNNMTQDKIPVYTMHLTANAGEDGILRFTRDIYKQNADVAAALVKAGFPTN